jgi:hypothetical protein
MGTFYSMMVKSEADRKAWSTSLSYFWEMHMMTKMASHQTRTVMMSRKTEIPMTVTRRVFELKFRI